MQATFKFIIDFFADLGNTAKFLFDFATDKKISRLRVLLVWTLVALIPSFFIYFTINTWQVHIPGMEAANANNASIISMVFSTSILPVMFFLTNGLRGYHSVYNYILDGIFSRFELMPFDEMIEKYGEDAPNKIKTVNIAKHVSGFVILEFIIIGWATASYFLFGGNMTGLGVVGYVGDDLLMGAIVFVLEGIYSVFDGFAEGKDIYRIKVPFISNNDAEADKWIEVTEGAHMLKDREPAAE